MNSEYREEVFDTDLGAVRARRYPNRVEFRGVRYAAAERWHAPVMVNSFSETVKHPGDDPQEPYDALDNGKKCFQKHWKEDEFYGKEFYVQPDYEVPESEDCLFVNITVPCGKEKPENGWPVAIWYHGGAFQNGYNCEAEFDGEGFAERGVLLVTANYRLNMFGYFCHPDLIKRDGSCGNYGLLDQLTALDWVKKHIASFGGDPDHISIFGQSAGSSSVECMLASPYIFDEDGKPKIKGAVLQSGITGVFSGNLKSMEECAGEFASVMEKRGQTLEDLEAMSPEELYQWGMECNISVEGLGLVFTPVLSAEVLPEDPSVRLIGGQFPKISYMAGCCMNDILAVPGPEPGGALAEGIASFLSECREKENPAYHYYFAHPLPGDDAGAFHTAELWFVFSTWKRSWRPFGKAERDLAELVASDWAAFFREGTPGYTAYDGTARTIRHYV